MKRRLSSWLSLFLAATLAIAGLSLVNPTTAGAVTCTHHFTNYNQVEAWICSDNHVVINRWYNGAYRLAIDYWYNPTYSSHDVNIYSNRMVIHGYHLGGTLNQCPDGSWAYMNLFSRRQYASWQNQASWTNYEVYNCSGTIMTGPVGSSAAVDFYYTTVTNNNGNWYAHNSYQYTVS